MAIGDFFDEVRSCVHRAIVLADEASAPGLRAQAALLLKEVSCRQNKIEELLSDAFILPSLGLCLTDPKPLIVRAGLAAVRAFAFVDDIKESFVFGSDIAMRCIAATRTHIAVAAVVEQAFGLFANLTIRKPHIAAWLQGSECRVVALAQLALERHVEKPGVMRSVIQTLRNVATKHEPTATDIKESGLFEELRVLLQKHQGERQWRSAHEISKQLLREFDALGHLRASAKHNEYY
eukprot:NODE_16697_length_982_cov_8.045614.p1 GENE.NODE_16697_length_982_cov_8.045614~~NODE_16697_length_982_cov_8.045614.p1  ORF type:complete len:245 (-),score=86.07 NODE_16697_length_982_cov_8.045614:247-954(-)